MHAPAGMMTKGVRVRGWRRIADAMWSPPDDPQMFGSLDLDARPVLRLIEQARARGHRLTPTHVVGRAVGHALRAVPDLNARIRGGRSYPRASVDVFFITAVDGGRDLSGVKVTEVDRRSALEVAAEVSTRSAQLKRGTDAEFSRTKRLMDALPPPVLRQALRLTAWLTEELGLDLPALALHRAPFGSAMVSSVGMFGIQHGFAPLSRIYDVPLIVLVGEITRRPVVSGDAVVVRDMLPITATIDHRYADGWHISQAMTAFRAYLAAPEQHEPPVEGCAGHPAPSPLRAMH